MDQWLFVHALPFQRKSTFTSSSCSLSSTSSLRVALPVPKVCSRNMPAMMPARTLISMQVDGDEKKKKGSLTTQLIAGGLILGLIATTFQPLANLLGGRQMSDMLLEEKLSRVPVFAVTDSTGRPYMSEMNEGRLRQGYFFIQPSDATEYLNQVPDGDVRIIAVSMKEVLKFLESPPSSSKTVPERFQLFPDDHQVDLAQSLSGNKFKSIYGQDGVPVFYVDGLAFKDEASGTNVLPLFFEKEKLDEAVRNLKSSNPDVSVSVENDLQIMDFLQTIKEIRAGNDPRFERIVYIPLGDALKKLNSLNAASKGSKSPAPQSEPATAS